MEDRNYREEIGKAIEEALELEDFDELEDLIEMPSPETFAKWVDMGQEKYEKRVRRKRLLTACAAVLVFCLGAAVAVHYINPPVTEAGPENDIVINNTVLESEMIYTSWDDLPVDVQETFVELKGLPEEYEIESIEVMGGLIGEKIKIYINYDGKELCVRQYLSDAQELPTSLVTGENTKKDILGYEVYIEKIEETKISTYKFLCDDIIVDIRVPIDTEENVIDEIIKAVSQ